MDQQILSNTNPITKNQKCQPRAKAMSWLPIQQLGIRVVDRLTYRQTRHRATPHNVAKNDKTKE